MVWAWPMVTSKILVSFLSHIKQKSVLRLAGPTCLKYAGESAGCIRYATFKDATTTPVFD